MIPLCSHLSHPIAEYTDIILYWEYVPKGRGRANVLDYNIITRAFELQSYYYILFWFNTYGK